MPYLLVHLEVEDYEKWKSVFLASKSHMKSHGCQGGQIFRTIDNPNQVTTIMQFDDLAKTREFMQSDDLKEAKERGGAAGSFSFYFLEEADRFSL